MTAFLAIIAQLLPWLVWISTLIGGINAWNSGTAVVVYGTTPDQSSIIATILPLLFAGLGQFGTAWLNKYLSSVTGKPVIGAVAEIASILAIREIAGNDAGRLKTVNTLAHQWVDKEFPLEVQVVAEKPVVRASWEQLA